jgi:hypothetical protein
MKNCKEKKARDETLFDAESKSFYIRANRIIDLTFDDFNRRMLLKALVFVKIFKNAYINCHSIHIYIYIYIYIYITVYGLQ